MSDLSTFDISELVAQFSDNELVQAANVCAEDLKEAYESDPESEWHEACFAGMIYFAKELTRRKLTLASGYLQ